MLENAAGATADMAFLTYVSAQCSPAYTATQYALLSSLAALAFHTVGGQSGYVEEALGYRLFFTATMFASTARPRSSCCNYAAPSPAGSAPDQPLRQREQARLAPAKRTAHPQSGKYPGKAVLYHAFVRFINADANVSHAARTTPRIEQCGTNTGHFPLSDTNLPHAAATIQHHAQKHKNRSLPIRIVLLCTASNTNAAYLYDLPLRRSQGMLFQLAYGIFCLPSIAICSLNAFITSQTRDRGIHPGTSSWNTENRMRAHRSAPDHRPVVLPHAGRRHPGVAGAAQRQPWRPAVQQPHKTAGYIESGEASWYGPRHEGLRTTSGERFDSSKMTAAHASLPLGSYVRVTDTSTGRSIVVRVNDREPAHGVRCIDLSHAAAARLGFASRGVADVTLAQATPEEAGTRPPEPGLPGPARPGTRRSPG